MQAKLNPAARGFLIPQSDEKTTLVQVVETRLPGVVTAFVYSPRVQRGSDPNLARLQQIGVLDVLFDSRAASNWIAVDATTPMPSLVVWRNRQPTTKGSTGVTFVSMSLLHAFVDACAGLRKWRSFADPKQLDYFLVDDANRPAEAKM